VGERTMAMKNARDLFAQTDQQVTVLKERIAASVRRLSRPS
jgi:hypothetical protein